MAGIKCPDCGAERFYVKDPEDQYNITEFKLKEQTIEYLGGETEADHIRIVQETEIFCDRCAWHDQFKMLTPHKGE